MPKKIISSILIIIILALWMPTQELLELFTSNAEEVETTWEYEFTGNVQNLKLPYKGIYKIEAFGAQGGTANSNVRGAKGTYQIGTITLEKDTDLAIYVGGQNGYNGGGAGNSVYGVGGGASDIRVGGTALSNRILVAGGGGGSSATPNYHYHTGSSAGGGCYGQPNYHYHSGSSTSGGGCYGKQVIVETRCPGRYTYDIPNSQEWGCNKCELPPPGDKRDEYKANGGRGSPCLRVISTSIHYEVNCGRTPGVTIDSYSVNCGKTPGVTVDSYNYLNGYENASSNGVEGNGSIAGGGGYYGGASNYAGTSYVDTSFSDVTTTEGSRQGNGYVKITLLESYPEVSISKNISSYTNENIILTAVAKDDVVGIKEEPYSWDGGARTATNTKTVTKNGTYSVNVINNHDYEETAEIEISNIDKIDPVVNSIEQAISSNKKQTILTIHATDTANADYAASGVEGYAITTTNIAPEANQFQTSNSFTVNKNGTYYA